MAALRIAGDQSLSLLAKHFRSTTKSKSTPKPFLLRYGHFCNASGEVVDEVMAVYMPAGQSYTGAQQVEIFCHGGRQVVGMILQLLIDSGARAAEAGEFTQLAFLSGRIDLARAEAVAEIIAANTKQAWSASREHLLGAYSDHVDQLRDKLVALLADIEAAIDFSEEEITPQSTQKWEQTASDVNDVIAGLIKSYSGGKIVREGFTVAIGGRPNAGKSSLFNLLLKQERALVTPTPGTTRDYLEEWIDFRGFALKLIDTAGLRERGSRTEQQGQARAREILKKADLAIWMVDLSARSWQQQLQDDLSSLGKLRIALVYNKLDVLSASRLAALPTDGEKTSCKTGKGMAALKRMLETAIDQQMPDLTSGYMVTSARHKQKLAMASSGVKRVVELLKQGESLDIVAFEMRGSIDALGEITGKVYTEEVLGRIFSTFCIGK